MEETDLKHQLIYAVIIIALIMFTQKAFPDKRKTEMSCIGQTCRLKTYDKKGNYESTREIDAHACKSFELHEQTRNPILSFFSRRSSRRREYSVTCVQENNTRFILFKNHIKSRRKAEEAIIELSSALQLKEVNFNYTFKEK